MKKQKHKTKLSAIAFVLVLTISAMAVVLPNATAHDPAWEIPTYSFVAVSPSPIGVGQSVLVTWWLDRLPQTAVGAYGDRWEWTVEITSPDGSKETLGPYTSDPVGGGYAVYTPDQVGTYKFQSIFPGDIYTGEPVHPTSPRGTEYIGDILLPSESAIAELTVQQDPIEGWEETPLPTEYWTRPIEGENREWWRIGGNWLAASELKYKFAEYTTAPKTAHVMWTRPIWFGGIPGGSSDGYLGSKGYYEGMSYERYWSPPIILHGRLYYNVQTPPRYGWYCVDLRTGEEIWFHNSTGPLQGGGGFSSSGNYPQLSFGQIYDYESPNQHGALAYLWSTYGDTWQMYDAWSGNWICNIDDVPRSILSGVGPDGSILRYVYDSDNGWLACWNTSRAIWYKDTWTSNEFWMWRPNLGETFDANNGYSWNVTAPKGLGDMGWRHKMLLDDRIIGTTGLGTYSYGTMGYTVFALSLKPESRGQLLWQKEYASPPTPNTTITLGPCSLEDGIFTIGIKETREWYGYDIDTGELVWGPTEPQRQYDMYDMRYGFRMGLAYGKLLTFGYSGIVYCYDMKTGQKLWEEPTESGGIDSYFDEGRYPLSLAFIADGKIYLYSSEHSPSEPKWRGSKLRCIDIESGETLWATLHWGNGPVIGDGYIVDLNAYDNQIYCYGKGPSKTTVTVQDDTISKGDSIMIKGTVIDTAAGTKQDEQAARFPNGLPAIADEYMTKWMEYVYKQKTMPMDAKGVPVTIDAIDPNGNFINIATVTSDTSGMFKKLWTLDSEGEYTIIATFEGSDSYYCSYAETAIGVGPAAAPSGPIEPEPTEPTEAPLITAEVAILLAAVIVAVAVIVGFWIIRKRK